MVDSRCFNIRYQRSFSVGNRDGLLFLVFNKTPSKGDIYIYIYVLGQNITMTGIADATE